MDNCSEEAGPIYFWRPHEEYGYLGQWYPSPFKTVDHIDPEIFLELQNCETYMMYHKAILFNDLDIADQILGSAEDPNAVKALGRQVKGFDQSIWDEKKFEIVVSGNREKFCQNEKLKILLLKTDGRELVEASPRDRIWGIGFGKNNAPKNKHRWGKNLLGKALMQVRAEFLLEGKKC
jgi:ribA/ribD-fused uncharacterized protein